MCLASSANEEMQTECPGRPPLRRWPLFAFWGTLGLGTVAPSMLFGAVGERLGMDRLLKSHNSQIRTYSLCRQGRMHDEQSQAFSPNERLC